MTSEQSQRGGAGSHQIQVAGDYVVHQGITAERAVAIAQEQAQIAISEYSKEAEGVARDRIESLVQKVIRELMDLESLDVLSDPAFQILLRKAELEAAATPDETDHEMLAKLLAERAKEPSKPMHLAVTRAVQVIEYLDQRALTGLTSIFYFTLLPASPNPLEAFAVADNLAAKLIRGSLPTGNGWLSRLSVLDCIHYEPAMGTTRSWDMIMMTSMPGYVSAGIPPESMKEISARLLALDSSLPALIVPHPFLPDRWRINARKSDALIESMNGTFQTSAASKEFEKILVDARVDQIDNDAIAAATKHVETKLPNLQSARTWWSTVQGIINLTPVGVAVAYSNARRFDNLEGLPPLADLIAT
jgi:hypothetical protein